MNHPDKAINVKQLLEIVFEVLNNSGLDYCVQNKYEMMPEEIPSDIDIFYRGVNEQQLDKIVKDVAIATNLLLVQKICNGSFQFAYMLSLPSPSSYFMLQLDCYSVLSMKKTFKRIYDPTHMLDNKRFYKCFYVPDYYDEVYYMIIRRTYKKDMSDEHLTIIREKFFQKEESIATKLINELGEKLGKLTIEMIIKSDKTIFYNNYSLYYAHILHCAKKNSSIKNSFNHLIYIYKSIIPKRIIHTCGISIAFLSPDGGGKSTIIERLKATCGGSFHGVEVKYFRPRWLKNAGHYKVVNQTKELTENPDPHGRPLNSMIKSLYRFLFYNFDFILGTWFLINPMKINRQLIIFDRYYYDYFVDLRRYQYNLPNWLPRLFSFMIPKPDIIFILDGPASVLYERKKELSIEEIERQRNKYVQIANRIKNAHVIDTNRPIDIVVGDVTRIVLETKTKQTSKILL